MLRWLTDSSLLRVRPTDDAKRHDPKHEEAQPQRVPRLDRVQDRGSSCQTIAGMATGACWAAAPNVKIAGEPLQGRACLGGRGALGHKPGQVNCSKVPRGHLATSAPRLQLTPRVDGPGDSSHLRALHQVLHNWAHCIFLRGRARRVQPNGTGLQHTANQSS